MSRNTDRRSWGALLAVLVVADAWLVWLAITHLG